MRRPPRSTRSDPLFPSTRRVRSASLSARFTKWGHAALKAQASHFVQSSKNVEVLNRRTCRAFAKVVQCRNQSRLARPFIAENEDVQPIGCADLLDFHPAQCFATRLVRDVDLDRKSTRLNSSH